MGSRAKNEMRRGASFEVGAAASPPNAPRRAARHDGRGNRQPVRVTMESPQRFLVHDIISIARSRRRQPDCCVACRDGLRALLRTPPSDGDRHRIATCDAAECIGASTRRLDRAMRTPRAGRERPPVRASGHQSQEPSPDPGDERAEHVEPTRRASAPGMDGEYGRIVDSIFQARRGGGRRDERHRSHARARPCRRRRRCRRHRAAAGNWWTRSRGSRRGRRTLRQTSDVANRQRSRP